MSESREAPCTEPLTFWVPVGTKARIKAVALRTGANVSSWARTMLLRALDTAEKEAS